MSDWPTHPPYRLTSGRAWIYYPVSRTDSFIESTPRIYYFLSVQFSSVQSLSRVRLFVTPLVHYSRVLLQNSLLSRFRPCSSRHSLSPPSPGPGRRGLPTSILPKVLVQFQDCLNCAFPKCMSQITTNQNSFSLFEFSTA